MIQFANQLPDMKLDKTEARAFYARKILFKKFKKDYVLLFLDAHMRPLAAVPFNDNTDDMADVYNAVIWDISMKYHAEGYIILFKNTNDKLSDSTVSIAKQLHAMLKISKADINDIILVGTKEYLSKATEKRGEIPQKQDT